MPMTDAEKFDRWWAENCPPTISLAYLSQVRGYAYNAFMAGAAAERAEDGAMSRLQPCPDCGLPVPPGDFHGGAHS